MTAEQVATLRRRLERERAARLEAEHIAECSTRELWDRQQQLVLLENLATIANATDDTTEAMRLFVAAICRHLGWPVGQAWLRDGSEQVLRLAPAGHVADVARYADFAQVSAAFEFSHNEGLPGQAWATGGAVVLPDVANELNFPRASVAASVDLHGAIAFPVQLHGETSAVLEFFTRAKIAADPDLTRVLSHAVQQLARVFERSETSEQLRVAAMHDTLTGLPNRRQFNLRAQQAVAFAREHGGAAAIALIDLDHFKDVNDTLGHAQGDRLLVEVGTRLTTMLRTDDTIARLGGDEFGLVLSDIADESDALFVADRVRAALVAPIEVDGVLVQVDASIGLAMYREHGHDVDTLVQHADIAMYEAKRRHLGCQMYRTELDAHSAERLGMAAALRRAIDAGELELHYQPQVAARAGRTVVTGVEALLRWNMNGHGYVPPAEFVSLAERTGLIRPLTSYVLSTAVAQATRWWRSGLLLPLAVNITARNLLDPDFPAEVMSLLGPGRLPAGLLELEVTESTMLEDQAATRLVLQQLSDAGISIAIDDFGTGFSSMAQLKQLPVSVLKIDRSFVSSMATDRRDASIVASTIQLGHDLALEVIAEGVDDEQTLRDLVSLGCDRVQGYLVSPPCPAEDLTVWLDGQVVQRYAPTIVSSQARSDEPAAQPVALVG